MRIRIDIEVSIECNAPNSFACDDLSAILVGSIGSILEDQKDIYVGQIKSDFVEIDGHED